tara:strand:- start:149 stop:829 length:681 start_codon:yes stop_codon:yes gene_type:complete
MNPFKRKIKHDYVAVRPGNYGWLEHKLNDEEMDFLWKCIENKQRDVKPLLAGQIDSSYALKDPGDWFFNNVVKKVLDAYEKEYGPEVSHSAGKLFPFNGIPPYYMRMFWVNFQKKHEFNPLHNHTALYSFVVWMKIPTDWKDQRKLKNSKDTNGQLNSCFMFHYLDLLGNIRAFTYRLSPEDEGTLLFFPGPLHHSVHPFYECDDDRITISGNITFNTNKVASNSW